MQFTDHAMCERIPTPSLKSLSFPKKRAVAAGDRPSQQPLWGQHTLGLVAICGAIDRLAVEVSSIFHEVAAPTIAIDTTHKGRGRATVGCSLLASSLFGSSTKRGHRSCERPRRYGYARFLDPEALRPKSPARSHWIPKGRSNAGRPVCARLDTAVWPSNSVPHVRSDPRVNEMAIRSDVNR
jgi:hypothetical protein